MPSLSAILSNVQHPPTSLLLVEASLSQFLPLLQTILRTSLRSKHNVLLITFSTPSSYFSRHVVDKSRLNLLDFSNRIPGYETSEDDAWLDPRDQILKTVKAASSAPLTVLLEGVDTLSDDLQSTSHALQFLKELMKQVRTLSAASRLVLSFSPTSSLLPLVIPPNVLSHNLVHLILRPASLLSHLANSFLVLPPPFTSETKFWALLTGAADRGEGVQPRSVRLNEGLVEVRVRSRKLERSLEGWRVRDGMVEAYDWKDLLGMRELIANLQNAEGSANQTSTDPTSNLPFNLTLTDAQQQARSAVPLPYAHSGEGGGGILYEPDSGDDVDEDDPDEDLEI